MKLVDILARELKEWPEGQKIAEQSKVDNEVYFEPENRGDFYVSSRAEDYLDAIVTRAQWQEAREALSKADDSVNWDWVWAKAPKKATHFMPAQSENNRPVFWRVENGVARHCWAMDSDLGNVRDEFRYSESGTPSYKLDLCIVRPQNEEKPWNGEGLPPVGTVCEWQANIRHREWVKTTICGHSTDGAYAAFYHDGNMGWSDDCRFRPIRTPEQIEAEERNAVLLEMQRAVDAGKHGPQITLQNTLMNLYDAGYRKVNDGNQKA